jgi:hypothetical protein
MFGPVFAYTFTGARGVVVDVVLVDDDVLVSRPRFDVWFPPSPVVQAARSRQQASAATVAMRRLWVTPLRRRFGTAMF